MTSAVRWFKEMLLMGKVAALEIEQELPRTILTEKDITSPVSPAPWKEVYFRHLSEPGVKFTLLMRSELSEVLAKLEAMIDEAETKDRPLDLGLRKVRRG